MTLGVPVIPILARAQPEEATSDQEETIMSADLNTKVKAHFVSPTVLADCSVRPNVPVVSTVGVSSSTCSTDPVQEKVDHCTGIRLVKVVHGSFNQNNGPFTYKGKQCMAIAWASLVKHKLHSVLSWYTDDLDYALILGDEEYTSLHDDDEIKDPSKHLSVTELHKTFMVSDQEFRCTEENTVTGFVH